MLTAAPGPRSCTHMHMHAIMAPFWLPHGAGATPAHAADKAGHVAVASLLRTAADGRTPEALPSREALVQRHLSTLIKDGAAAPAAGSGAAAGARLAGRAGSIQLAAAEEGGASVEVLTVARANVAVGAVAPEGPAPDSPTTSQGNDGGSSSSSGKTERSASLPEPAAAAGGAPAQRKATAAELAAARQLVRRGFEGMGTPGEELTSGG